MRVNIVTEGISNGWILRKLATELASRLSYVGIGSDPADINYFINYALFRPAKGISIGFFTHLEESGPFRQRFYDVAAEIDHCVAECRLTQTILAHRCQRSSTVIHPGTHLRKKLVFGVVGRTYPNQRKGEWLVEKMVQDGHEVIAHGQGWPCRIFSNDYGKIEEFYRQIDYLVVTSYNEGGPVCLADALGAGVPVIAPAEVGWCSEFSTLQYEKGNWPSLKRVLEGLNPPTWDQWAENHDALFRKIYECRVG